MGKPDNGPAHSLLGASGMHRWAACPGSVRLIREVGPGASSAYAEEGTDAHALAATYLNNTRLDIRSWVDTEVEIDGRTFTVTEEMVDAVERYAEVVGSLMVGASKLFIEQRFDLSAVHPGCFGTADAVVWRPHTRELYVIDFKYGAGIAVDVKENPQLTYYALGAFLQLKLPAEHVELVVVQPRAYHPDGDVRKWGASPSELLDFRRDLIDFAKQTEAADAPLVAGDHCRFCPALTTCPKVKEMRQEVARGKFAKVNALAGEDLKLALESVPLLQAWCKAVHEYAFAMASNGRAVPGYKLVDKRASRKWISELRAAEWARKIADLDDDEIFKPRAMVGVPAIEKLVGKGAVPLDLITAESSGLTLVPADDNRPPVVKSAAAKFASVTERK